MTSTREQLKEVYRLIRQDQPQEAQQLLRLILDAEPQNVHAWWLLAYSVDDPYEVRDALKKVLEIDPNYSNAPKAREMLQALEEQFFAAGVEPAGDQYADEYGSISNDELEGAFEHVEAHGPGYGGEYTVDEAFFAGDDLIDSDESLTLFEQEDDSSADEFFAGEADDEPDLDDTFSSAAVVEADTADEDIATAEERTARHTGGRGCVRIALLLVLIVVVAIAGFLLLTRDTGSDLEDPGVLTEVTLDSPGITEALQATEADLAVVGIGPERRVYVASTALGNTLIAEFCQEPASDIAQNIALAMRTVAQNGAAISDAVDAVGISITRCNAETYDTLYRAIAPMNDVQNYLRGVSGDTETAWIEFQRQWRKS